MELFLIRILCSCFLVPVVRFLLVFIPQFCSRFFYFVFWWWNSFDCVLVWLTVPNLSMVEIPQFKRMSKVKKGQIKERAVKVTANVHCVMMAERTKYIVVNI